MFVSVGMEDGLSVRLEVEGGYSLDVLEDLCTRARDLFRLSITDQAHLDTEHGPVE